MYRRLSLMLLCGLTACAFADPDKRPVHQYDLQHVKLDVTLNFKGENVSGSVEHTLTTTFKNAVLDFDKGPMTIQSVTSGGKKLDFKVTDKNLFVTLAGVPAKKQMTVKITYTASPEAGIYFVPANRAYPSTVSLAYTQGEMEDNRYWFPVYDYPDDKATTELIAHVPKGMSVLSNGRLAEHTTSGEQETWHWSMEQPMATYLISLVAGDYVSIPDGEFKGKPVQIWAPRGTEAMATEAFQGTDKLIAIYSKLTGVDYPWAKYAQSVVPEFMFGGMENASCTTQTIGAIYPPNSHGTNSARGLDAHELAHQWFGDLITCKNWSHIWVNEGWASFMPHFVTREMDGESAYHIERWGTYEGAKGASKGAPMVRSNYTVPMEMFDGNAYPGGATRMMMLMHQLGEDVFWKCTQKYLTDFGHKNVTTEDFFTSFSKTSGADLDEFRKLWFYQQGCPNYVVKRTGGEVEITQATPNFDVPVEYAILNDQGVVTRGRVSTPRTINVDDNQTLVVDPGAWTMCDQDYQAGYTPADWKRMWLFADNDAQRMRIIGRQTQPTLKATFLDLKTPHALARVVLGYVTDEPTLLNYAHMDTNDLSLVAMDGLMRIGSKKAADVFDDLLKNSQNEVVKNAAYQNLLNLKNDEATANRGLTMKTFNLAPPQAALRWLAGHQPDRARQLALTWVKDFAPGPQRMTAISVLGQLKDKAGEHEVYDLLVELAKSKSYAPMSAGINALAEYGDPKAIPVIQARAHHSLHFARGTVQGALARLRK